MEKVMIADVTKEQRISKANGKPYTQYNVKYGDDFIINTIDKNFGEYLINNKGNEVEWELENGQYGMKIKSINGVVKEQRTGGGGFKKYDPETIARMDKRDKERVEGINRSVALNDATMLVAAEIKSGIKFEDIPQQTTLYADVLLGWLTKGGK